MAGPITWRNVGATTSSSGVGSLMQGAQSSFDKGIGALDKVLEQAKGTQQANWDQGKTNNTNAVMDALYAQQDPEALAQAQATGQFQQMMAGMGSQVDQAAVRTALDNRGGVLQDRAVANQGYQDHNARVGQRDVVAQIQQLAHAGDIAGAQALASQLQIDQGEHLGTVTDLRRNFEADGRAEQSLANDRTRIGLDRQRVGMAQQRLDIELGQLSRTNQAEALLRNTFTGLEQANQAQQQARQVVIQGSGLPLTDTGEVDWNAIPSEQHAQTQEYLESNLRLIDPPAIPTQTQVRQQMEAALRNLGLPAKDQQQYLEHLDQQWAVNTQLAPDQQAELEKQTNRVTQQFAPQVDRLTQEYERAVADDPLGKAVYNPEERTVALMKPFTENFNPTLDYSPLGVSNARQFGEMQQFIQGTLSNGLQVGNETIEVPEGVIGLALQEAQQYKDKGGLFGFNLKDKTEEILRNYVESPNYRQRIEDAGKRQAEYQTRLNELTMQAEAQNSSIRGRFLRDNGLIIPSR